MPTILAIETSSEIAQAALLHAGQTHLLCASGVQNHSLHILPMVQQLLHDAGIKLGACDAIAYGAGPGSFTGVRTACGIAQGLGFASKLPLLAMSTLASMAQACRNELDLSTSFDVLTVLDARMGQVYWAQYRWLDNSQWQEIQAPALTDPAQVQLSAAPHGPSYVCGNAFEHYALPGLGEVSALSRINAVQGPCAKAMAQLAAIALAQKQGISAQQAQPLYLRNKIAYTSAERAQGLQPRSGT